MEERNLSDWTVFSNYKKNHPFIDLYTCNCSKALAYDGIANTLQLTTDDNVLYLGDSENDNPAFKRAETFHSG